jgi:hypothetical protein
MANSTLNLDGTANGYAATATARTKFNQATFTAECWWQWTGASTWQAGTTGQQMIYSNMNSANSGGLFYIFIDWTGDATHSVNLWGGVRNGTSSLTATTQGVKIQIGADNFVGGFPYYETVYTRLIDPLAWHHTGITYTNSPNKTVKLFLDGMQVGTVNATSSSTFQTNNPITVGRDANASKLFVGRVREARFWSTDRGANGTTWTNTIRANMNSTVANNATGLVARYPFDDGSTTTATDTCTNQTAANMTLQSGATWTTKSDPFTLHQLPVTPTMLLEESGFGYQAFDNSSDGGLFTVGASPGDGSTHPVTVKLNYMGTTGNAYMEVRLSPVVGTPWGSMGDTLSTVEFVGQGTYSETFSVPNNYTLVGMMHIPSGEHVFIGSTYRVLT